MWLHGHDQIFILYNGDTVATVPRSLKVVDSDLHAGIAVGGKHSLPQ